MKFTIYYLLLTIVFCDIAYGTVTETSCTTTSACNGSATEFTFGFPINETSDILVILRTLATGAETILEETTDYSVSAVNNDYFAGPGGTVTTVETYSSSYTLTILRDVPTTQDADFEDLGKLKLESINSAYDKVTMLIQQLQEEIDRCLKIPRTEHGTTTEFDDAVNRASMIMGFDENGGPTALDSIPEGSVTVSAYMETVNASVDAESAKTKLEIPTITSFAETALDDENAAAVRTTIGAAGLTGDETIAGVKTFTGANVHSGINTLGDGSRLASSAAPTDDADIANIKYCDDKHLPLARMYLNTEQNNLTDVTWTTIAIDTDTFDSGAITDTANYRITPAVAGYYLVIGQVCFTNVIADKTYSAQIYKNGTTAMKTSSEQIGASTSDVPVEVTDVVLLDDDDYLQLRGYVNAGADTVDIKTGTANTNLVLIRQ